MPHLIPGSGGFMTALGILLFCWVTSYLLTGDTEYTFEPRGPGSFEPRLANYLRAAELVIGLATASIVLLARLLSIQVRRKTPLVLRLTTCLAGHERCLCHFLHSLPRILL